MNDGERLQVTTQTLVFSQWTSLSSHLLHTVMDWLWRYCLHTVCFVLICASKQVPCGQQAPCGRWWL